MDGTLTNSDRANDREAPRAIWKTRRRKRFIVVLRSVFALALLALGLIAFNRFDEDISFCAANWVLHPRTACWVSAYDH